MYAAGGATVMPAAVASRATFLKTFLHPVKSFVWRRIASEEVLHTVTAFHILPETTEWNCHMFCALHAIWTTQLA